MECLLVITDIEKALDLLDHNVLIFTLEKHGIFFNFILWVKIVLRDQDLCAINRGTTTKYFPRGRGACEGDPISAFFYLIYLYYIFFLLINLKPEIDGITIFYCNYLYPAYTDDTIFFLMDITSMKHMVDTFFFPCFSLLKPNLTKSKTTLLESWKGFKWQSVACVV